MQTGVVVFFKIHCTKEQLYTLFKYFLLAPFFKKPLKVGRKCVALLCGSYLNLFSIQHVQRLDDVFNSEAV